MSSLSLSAEEKKIRRLIKSLSLVDEKSIDKVFKALYYITMCVAYSELYSKDGNKKIDTPLNNMTIMIPYLLGFKIKLDTNSIYLSSFKNPINLEDVQLSSDLKHKLRLLLDDNHSEIKREIIEGANLEFKKKLGFNPPSVIDSE